MNAVCMKCLDGKDSDRKLCCRFCATQWDGSSLIMGTMYAYDVFAAMPCCNERLKVCIINVCVNDGKEWQWTEFQCPKKQPDHAH